MVEGARGRRESEEGYTHVCVCVLCSQHNVSVHLPHLTHTQCLHLNCVHSPKDGRPIPVCPRLQLGEPSSLFLLVGLHPGLHSLLLFLKEGLHISVDGLHCRIITAIGERGHWRGEGRGRGQDEGRVRGGRRGGEERGRAQGGGEERDER